jgi:hypothetical protein
VTRGR